MELPDKKTVGKSPGSRNHHPNDWIRDPVLTAPRGCRTHHLISQHSTPPPREPSWLLVSLCVCFHDESGMDYAAHRLEHSREDRVWLLSLGPERRCSLYRASGIASFRGSQLPRHEDIPAALWRNPRERHTGFLPVYGHASEPQWKRTLRSQDEQSLLIQLSFRWGSEPELPCQDTSEYLTPPFFF